MVGRVNLHVYAAEEIHAKFGVFRGEVVNRVPVLQ